MSDDTLYDKILSENLEKGFQVRLVVSEFRDTQYIHLRKYFLSYEGEWIPSKEGISIPASIQSIYSLLDGLIEICSVEESIDAINIHFKERLSLLHEQSRSPPK